ncbi:MAG: hypothetical protein ACKO2P_07605 [Planctomycetota bacterium]
MHDTFESKFLVYFLLLELLALTFISISILTTLSIGAIHWFRRRARERHEGTHTAVAQGSRAGAKLGLAAALLISIISSAVTSPGMWNPVTLAFLIIASLPMALWGMVSGSIAGGCATRRSAVLVCALMFPIQGDPLGMPPALGSALKSAVQGTMPMQSLAELSGYLLVHMATGALVGNAAFRLGHQRAAKRAGNTAIPGQHVAPRLTTGSPATPTVNWNSLE